MNQYIDTRLNYDSCSYKEKLRRTVGPGLYQLDVPSNDCEECYRDIPADPSLRYQNYGHNTCSMKNAIDDSNELLGLNYKNTKCNEEEYMPGKYNKTGCYIKGVTDARQCMIPREDTRLSNPPCTLHGTGWNRWEWLCYNPQDKAIIPFEWNVNANMLMRDNHKPCLERPMDQSNTLPVAKQMDPTYYSMSDCGYKSTGAGGPNDTTGQKFGGMSSCKNLSQL